ncbi:MAG: type I-E CRISPR-associated protein Cas7/Cse4/CasC [Candidatus Omnitrophota bacterium]
MRHLELHILQSFPVTCLNRDDLNSPKTAIFGGVQRARVSSQCWKRAVRELAQEALPEFFKGQRGRLIVEPLKAALLKEGFDEAKAFAAAKEIAEYLAKYDKDAEKKNGVLRVKTAYFTTQAEIGKIAKAYKKEENVKKAVKEIKSEDLKDAADISLFGRMVANDHTLTIEGAAMFNHALSVHKVDNEIDYFSTKEDFPNIDAGAAMTGTLEFNSATYYRFAALNMDMLFDKDHLACLNEKERKEVVKTFVKSVIEAVPVARRNSQNGDVRPKHVLCVIREKGHPVQLINAFEEPIFGKNGIAKRSVEELEKEYANLKEKWEVSAIAEIRLPEKKMSELLAEVEKHVK